MIYNIIEQGDNFFINGIEIPNEIFEQEKTDRNVYAINEFGDYEANEVFYITENQAKQLNFI